MKFRSLPLLPFAALVAAFVSPHRTSAETVSIAHLERGETLVAQIVSAQAAGTFEEADTLLNVYGGSWDSLTDYSFFRLADPARAIPARNRTTCAPLVTHLLKSAYGWRWSSYSIPHPRTGVLKASASPNPVYYYAAIKNKIGFAAQIEKLTAAQPGDILSIWYKDKTGDEGHTMVLVALDPTPKPYTAVVDAKTKPEHAAIVPQLTGKLVYEVTVLDSSATGHTYPAPAGTSHPAQLTNAEIDTRWVALPDPTDDTQRLAPALTGGAGIGVIGVVVNPTDGKIVGYTWSLPFADYATGSAAWHNGINDRIVFQATRELVIGRLPAGLAVLPAQPGVEQKK